MVDPPLDIPVFQGAHLGFLSEAKPLNSTHLWLGRAEKGMKEWKRNGNYSIVGGYQESFFT